MRDASEIPGSRCIVPVRIIATSDVHARLWPFDYIGDVEAAGQGLAVLSSTIDALRDEVPNALVLDNGDTLEGTPLADLAVARKDPVHPMIAAMNAIGFDAATPGNHDFNYGYDVLRSAAETAEFPFTLSNITHRDGTEILPRSLVITRHFVDETGRTHSLRIGIVGMAPPQTMDWEESHLKGLLRAEAIVPAARAQLHRLREVEAVDLTIALCHSGIDPNAPPDGGENGVVPLAADGLADVIIAGHSHMEFPGLDFYGDARIDPQAGTVHGVTVVQPGAYGRCVGVVDLKVEFRPDGTRFVTDRRPRLVAAGAAPPNPAILALTETAHAQTRAEMGTVLGHSSAPLMGYFDLFSGCCILNLVAEAKQTRATELLARSGAEPLPLLTVVGPTRSGGRDGQEPFTDIPAGPLRMRHVFDIYAYANRLTVLKINGAGLRSWLEHAARAFHRITPGVPGQKLINLGVAGYHFDVIHGLTYEFDLTAERKDLDPDGPGRVRHLCYDGKPVQDDDWFHLATSSYRAGGGGGFAAARTAEVVLATNLLIRDILAEHIRTTQDIVPTLKSNWRFADAGGTGVIAETGRGAAQIIDIAEAEGFEFLGISDEGLAQFLLTL